ncbi:metal-dependent hydrolase [Neolewinella lacunae]|uniref:Metal-dependent hydrolase n=1 Tax=Neolewinella lacunae TaxID=1517758 RepID=A0A923PGR4_9BACT|nr:metal-dependent hydrolase [Neolewinella lacunae]MBC6993767.1 metal-dependent hydrolase [Neolewinella lacunae]MDN3636141.1 metal-dependent hydrolase [Neolewinella lacunae]
MDSLTQIILGAAVGEATLGRKVGNRAMLWGGIAGTLPDLDVLANAVSDPMSALAYHRAFTHSLLFAVLAAPLLGLAIHRLYGGKDGPLPGPWAYPALLMLFYAMLTAGSYAMPIEIYHIPGITLAITLAFGGIFLVVAALRWLRGFPQKIPNTSWGGWTLLAFGAIVTHPLLDCFTAYGTQFLQPLASTRITWNTISVVDPLYTLPFLALLVWARTQVQGTAKRQWLNRAGLVLSSVYLLLTVVNYFNVEGIMEDSLAEEGIEAESLVVSPSIFNNVLWSGTAREGKDVFYFSQYSLFDRERSFAPYTRIEGNHAWLAPYANDRDLRILQWFTKGYYGVMPGSGGSEGQVQVNDLRYGLLDEDPTSPSSYIFSWQVDTTVHPVRAWQAPPGDNVDMNDLFSRLWKRIKGI